MGAYMSSEDDMIADGIMGGASPEPEEGVVVGDGSTGPDAKMTGYLHKQGHLVKNWKKRWFVLDWPVLKYYKSPTDKTPRGTVTCSEVTLSDKLARERTGKENCFGIFHPDRKTYFLQADNEEDMMRWVKAVRNVKKVGLIDFDELKTLGQGNFGKVLLVRQKVTDKLLAMKVLRKETVVKRNDVEHTRTERNVLRKIRHPFVVQLQYAFQTGDKLYMVMDYVAGGDLYYHLKQLRKFTEDVVKVWIGELVLAIGYLHELGVVFRDLKPENILLDARGHLHLADFGLSKQIDSIDQSLTTFCGTPYYLAPEIVQVTKERGYSKSVDWWAVGVLMYELLIGNPPFVGKNMQGVYNQILHLPHVKLMKDFKSRGVTDQGQHLMVGLLNRDPEKRLGAGARDSDAIREHPWFADQPWEDLLAKKIEPAYKPTIRSETDTSNFDDYWTRQKAEESVHLPDKPEEGPGEFAGFTYAGDAGAMSRTTGDDL